MVILLVFLRQFVLKIDKLINCHLDYKSIHLKKVLGGRMTHVMNGLIMDLDVHTHEFAICP